ncbi:MAG: 6-bladed beta-propeller, partial [Candidatus Mariimomonas ferrooxydans]
MFDLEGNFLYMFGHEGKGPGELGRPMLIDIKDNRIYVPEYLNDRVQIFSLTGEPLETIGSSGKGAAEFDAPGGVAIGEDGKLYVADFYNHRIQVLSPEGSLLLQLGETGVKGIRAGLFNYPTDVALLPNNSTLPQPSLTAPGTPHYLNHHS